VLYLLCWRKKKADFIIPPTYFRNTSYSIVESKNSNVEVPKSLAPKIEIPATTSIEEVAVSATIAPVEKTEVIDNSENKPVFIPTDNQPKVSALSLSSIRAKKELLEAQKGTVREAEHLPTEEFTENQMLEFWFKYAQRLNDKGQMIMESLLRITDPKLEGTKIIYELPNEGSKIDFEKAKPELLGYLRGHLHNHDILIEVIVNESVKIKNAFTAQDKFNRLNEINPNLEVLKKMFDLDI